MIKTYCVAPKGTYKYGGLGLRRPNNGPTSSDLYGAACLPQAAPNRKELIYVVPISSNFLFNLFYI